MATNKIKKINIFKLDVSGLNTIKTPQKPIEIAIQLIKLSFSSKITFANIRRKKGEVIKSIVKIFIGMCLSDKNTISNIGIKKIPLKIGNK